MTPIQIVLLVAGILGFQVLVWIPILVWMKKKSARLIAELTQDLASRSERTTHGPATTLYRGASADFPRVKGNGVIALTERRLVFRPLVGAAIELPIDQIVEVREDTWFLRSAKGGLKHVIVKTKSGTEVGWMFSRDQHQAWLEAFRAIASRVPG